MAPKIQRKEEGKVWRSSVGEKGLEKWKKRHQRRAGDAACQDPGQRQAGGILERAEEASVGRQGTAGQEGSTHL